MKKTYMMPALQVSEAEAENMLAVSMINSNADPNGEVLTNEDKSWSVWDDEAE